MCILYHQILDLKGPLSEVELYVLYFFYLNVHIKLNWHFPGPANVPTLRLDKLLNLPLETGVSCEIRNIAQEIRDKYRQFGKRLIRRFHVGEMNREEIIQNILQKWLNGEGRHGRPAVTWLELAHTLDRIGRNDLYQIVRKNCHSLELNLDTLLNFPDKTTGVTKSANIPREVGMKYFEFGTHLLQDPTGAHLRDLEHQLFRNGEEINQRILMEWLEGKGRPVTWATLVEVLNIIGMGELAKQIKERYINS